MMPQLFSFGPLALSAFGLFFGLAFIVLLFLVWKSVKEAGIEDEKIFDNIIVISLVSLFGARLMYILLHWELFAPNLLRTLVIWRFPGLSFWGGLLFAILSLYFFTHQQKLSPRVFFDGYAKAFPFVMFVMSVGLFLDGTITGKVTQWPIGLPVSNKVGYRHPVALYGVLLALIGAALVIVLQKFLPRKIQQKGIFSWAILSYIGCTQLILAFFRDDLLYWQSFSPDLFLATILTIMPLVPLYKLLDGSEKIKFLLVKIKERGASKV